MAEFSNLNESIVRYFKGLYQQKLKEEAKNNNPLPVTALPTQPRGRPPLLLELDAKLIIDKYLQAVRRKGKYKKSQNRQQMYLQIIVTLR